MIGEEATRKKDAGQPPIDEGDASRVPTTPVSRPEMAQHNEALIKHAFDRAMVRWTAAVALFTLGLLAAAIFQYFVMRGQQAVMQGQLDAMEADQRPWIGAPEIKTETVSPGLVGFTLTFKNGDRTPTAGLWVDAAIVRGDNYAWLAEGNRLCDRGKVDAKKFPDLFPIFSLTPGAAWAVVSTPTTNFTRVSLSDIAKIESPHIAGCAIYGSRIDKAIHKTVFDAALSVGDGTVSIESIVAAGAD